MIKLLWQKLALFRRAEFLSPRDLLQRALGISVLFLLAHLAGLREFTSVLNGTVGSVAAGWKLSSFLALIYILLYLAFVILVPVLVLAAMILTVWRRGVQKEENSRIAQETSSRRPDAAG
jgi:membrane protein implicated in regulation of membrane protease activity